MKKNHKTTTRTKKTALRQRAAAALAVAAVIGAATYAYAIPNTPAHTFNAGDIISSAEVNKNFQDLYSAVAALENKTSPSNCQWVSKASNSSAIKALCPGGKTPISVACTGTSQSYNYGSLPQNDGAWCYFNAKANNEAHALCCEL